MSSVIGPPADNGDPTFTHALPDGSPTIDLFGSSFCAEADQTGTVQPHGRSCDAGTVKLTYGDAPASTISIGNASVAEGNSGTRNLSFTVTLDPAADKAVSVQAATADDPAESGSDFVVKAAARLAARQRRVPDRG